MSGELAPYNPEALPIRRSVTAGKLVDADVWTTYANIAQNVANTEFVPKDLRGKAPSVLACLLYGHDLGLGPMVALREITMIEGKPALSAALVTARVREAGHTLTWENIHGGDGEVVGVTARGKRADNGDVGEYTFTLKMAQRAGLVRERGPWQKYPESMCWARAATQLARMLFSDVFLGHATYAPEEIGGEIEDADVVMEIESSGAQEAPPDSGEHGTESVEAATVSVPQPASPAASTPAAGPGGDGASSGPSPFAPPASVPVQKPASAAQKKALNALIGRVREQAGRVTTAELWAFVGRVPDTPEDGEHFAPLRESLTLHEASELIEHLKTLEGFAVADGALEPRRAA